ncbi:MAG: Ser-tRNA(Thr) hydrolase / threonyl-tRNA synthetase [Acidobacteria bacterium]|nr:Ser-tRNA(Thr) hydrolase / threonyl-tRNA synthetase [Acidobacteriota bacterium]
MSEINVQLNDGAATQLVGPVTVGEALKRLDRDVAKQALAARVNGAEVDLAFELDSANGNVLKIEPVLPQTLAGLEVLRHSTAHLLAAAVLDLFPGTQLGIGPALLDDPRYGFFYDVIAPRALTEADLPVIEKRMREIVKRSMPYRREEIAKADALRIFEERAEPLKCKLIDDKGGETVSVYYIDGSPFIDFCLGPHVPHTGKLRAFKLLSLAGAYWMGDSEQPQMQRIYGTAFFSQEELDAWLKQREEAEKRDHRRLGRELDLFSIQEEYGQGLIFWHPKGGIIRQQMENYLREELIKRDYSFVYTPHIAKRELWRISGHEQSYGDAMFAPTTIEEVEFRLKPMNCPFHIGIYKSQQRSYRDLPQRYSEMGTVYRAELSGTLHGLMRVRGFTVDDAHLFCTPEQVRNEIDGCVDFAYQVLKTFGFEKIKFELSVKGSDTSKSWLGSDEEWKNAEAAMAAGLDGRGIDYERIEGEAAFYGPKIDFKIEDAIGRLWQLGTVQWDFNLPERFELEYIGEDNKPHRPVMVHRALFGSIERFFGVLIEHYAGAFPLWLAPVQVAVLPITDRVNDYAAGVAAELRKSGLRVEANLRSEKIGAKIRDAQMQKVPFMLVLGDREVEQQQVAVRERVQGDIGAMSLEEFKTKAHRLIESRALTNT